MKIKFLLIFTFLCLVSGFLLHAQTLPVGLLDNVEDTYRRQQLLGKDSSNSSYMVRPMYILKSKNFQLDGDTTFNVNNLMKLLYTNSSSNIKVYALPVVWQNQENTHHPYGINDGSMVQSNGYQTQISGGLFAQLGPLTIQLRPEYVYAENKYFQKLSDAPNGAQFTYPVAQVYNSIDLPDRFGDGQYSKLTWGQSSIRLNAGPVSLGLSNENLWWGPGVRNSLLMSNNASGFKHLTLNTIRPIKTYIGSFEAQIIGGRLEQSGIALPEGPDYVNKPKDWRYMSGLVVTYQPKWIPNFFLGLERVYLVNHRQMGNSFGDYFPIFNAPEKSSYTNADGTNVEDAAARDQYISFFTRYVLPEAKAEIYFEYGRNDHSYNSRDGLVEPEHSRAYIAGFRKLITLPKADEYLQLGVEVTQLQEPSTRFLRETPPWYRHNQVTDGYTNDGQVLGAGIGPGSNLQTFDINWVKGLKKIGFTFERQVNNNDLFYDFSSSSSGDSQHVNRRWIDLSFASNFAWTYKHFVFNSQLVYIRSLNYQYQETQHINTGKITGKDVDNLHLKVGILYNW